nr:MAG TPA: hypothetical protein [Caudoviricetes sp.]
MMITNEAQLANSLKTLLRVGFDYLGITCYPVKFHW